MRGPDYMAELLERLHLPELQTTSEAAQKHFENHILTCLSCKPGLLTEAYCARGRWLDAVRRIAFSLATAPRRRG